MNGTAPDPGKAGLFTIDKSLALLNMKGVDRIMTTRLLFVIEVARQDIQIDVV